MPRIAVVAHVPYSLDTFIWPVVEDLAKKHEVSVFLPASFRTSESQEYLRGVNWCRANEIVVHHYPNAKKNLRSTLKEYASLAAHYPDFDAGIFHIGVDPVSLLLLQVISCKRKIIWYPTNHLLLQQREFTEALLPSGTAYEGLSRLHTAYRSKAARSRHARSSLLALLRSVQLVALVTFREELPREVLPRLYGFRSLRRTRVERKTTFPQNRGDLILVNSPLARRIEQEFNANARVLQFEHPWLANTSSQTRYSAHPSPTRVMLLFSGDPFEASTEAFADFLGDLPRVADVGIRPHPNAGVESLERFRLALKSHGFDSVALPGEQSLRMALEEWRPDVVAGTASSALFDAMAIRPEARVVGLWADPIAHPDPCDTPPSPSVRMGEDYPGSSGIEWFGNGLMDSGQMELRFIPGWSPATVVDAVDVVLTAGCDDSATTSREGAHHPHRHL